MRNTWDHSGPKTIETAVLGPGMADRVFFGRYPRGRFILPMPPPPPPVTLREALERASRFLGLAVPLPPRRPSL